MTSLVVSSASWSCLFNFLLLLLLFYQAAVCFWIQFDSFGTLERAYRLSLHNLPEMFLFGGG